MNVNVNYLVLFMFNLSTVLIQYTISDFTSSSKLIKYEGLHLKDFFSELKRKKGDLFPVYFCKSGQPIFKFKLCDGMVDCVDGSDETLNICGNNECNEEQFRCNYGACILKKYVCNRVYNCADGSDENESFCTANNCIIPTSTNTTVYYVPGCNGCKAGITTKEGTILEYQCLNNSTDLNNYVHKIVCQSSKWTPFLPNCTSGPNSNNCESTNMSSTDSNISLMMLNSTTPVKQLNSTSIQSTFETNQMTGDSSTTESVAP